ncbi:MAG: ABC transporter ATP-binding protein [Planctomycetota bacterium]
MSADRHEEESLGKPFDRGLFLRFLRCVKPYRLLVLAAFGGIAVQAALELCEPLVVMRAIDGPIAGGDVRGLLGYVALFAGVVLANLLVRTGNEVLTNRIGQSILNDLRHDVYRHMHDLPLSWFDRNPVGRLITRVTNDVEALKELFTSGIVSAASDVLLLAGILVMMFLTDVRLALVTLAIVPLVGGASLLFRRHAREAYREMRRKVAALNTSLQENVAGVRVTQLFHRQGRNRVEFDEVNRGYRDAGLRALLNYSLFLPTVEFLSALSTALLLLVGGRRILSGELSFGAFMAFWYYAQKFFQPIRDLSEKYNVLQSAMAASERIFGVLDTPIELRSPDHPVAPGALRGEIEFRNVWFAYRGEEWVLRDVSFRVEPGRMAALVGLTGAGKTTIIHLLCRFYDPQRGQVLVDGVDVREYDLPAYRRQVGLVLQDVFLFSGTVAENLSMGEAVPPERILAAAAHVYADKVIERLPGGLSAEVAERGATFSVGERQLLSFARAVATDPRVLVLDEATSSVDSETEARIQAALSRLLEGRTSLVVAHRLSTVQRADRIFVLLKGRIAEEGSHRDLLAAGGAYAKLYRLQFVEREDVSARA